MRFPRDFCSPELRPELSGGGHAWSLKSHVQHSLLSTPSAKVHACGLALLFTAVLHVC